MRILTSSLAMAALLAVTGCKHIGSEVNLKQAATDSGLTNITTGDGTFKDYTATGYHKSTEIGIGVGLPFIGKFLELWQWRSAEPPRAGYVLEARRLKEAKGLAEGKKEGDTWTVTFTRPLAGGSGVHAIAPGKKYNFGFAIHDDHADWRYHHVSFGYSFGLDNPKADVNAVKQ